MHYVAFLRGINLGNRRVKMEHLRRLFEQLPYREVATFIASGNVLFASPARAGSRLEAQIERHLAGTLGYAVDTFVRTRAEVAAVLDFPPFSPAETAAPADTIHVGFFKQAPAADLARGLAAIRTDVDEFRVAGREFYWRCRLPRTSDSTVWSLPALRALRLPTVTMRNLSMLRRLAEQFPA